MNVDESEPILYLTQQLTDAERERDGLALKAQRLEMLQRSFVQIIASTHEDDLAKAVLRGAWLGLGFSRAMWFRVEEGGRPSAAFELDGDDAVTSEYGDALPEGSCLHRIARGDSDAATGYEGDVDAPLFDTRRWYAIAAVRVRATPPFIVYADGAPERLASPWAISSLGELATHAALALDRMRMTVELERLAMHDPLTGLLNRRALMERLAIELATARRTGEPLGFAMIDVDDFKRINDTRGHVGGDAALQTIAHILRSSTRETDVPARFAGDEFSLILPRSDRHAAEIVMQRVYDALTQAKLACSTGIAFSSELTHNTEALIVRADEAVYTAKADGKNCFRFA